MGVPQHGWCIMGNPISIDYLGVHTPISGNFHVYIYIYAHVYIILQTLLGNRTSSVQCIGTVIAGTDAKHGRSGSAAGAEPADNSLPHVQRRW